jgi:hypothetical protein
MKRSLGTYSGLTPPLFIEVSVPNQENERSYTCVLGLILSTYPSKIFRLALVTFRKCFSWYTEFEIVYIII